MTASPTNVVLKYPATGTVTRQVTIATTGVEQNWTKLITVYTNATSSSNRDINTEQTKPRLVDFGLKKERRFTVDGFLETDVGSGDTNAYAYDKKEDIHDMMFKGLGLLRLTYQGDTYTVAPEKASLKWTPEDNVSSTTEIPIDRYSVKITLIEADSEVGN